MQTEPSIELPSLDELGWSPEGLLDALRNEVELPYGAVAVATLHASAIERDVIAVLERATVEDLDAVSEWRLLFRGLHILGGRRLPGAYRACIAFLRSDKARVERLLGDAATETLPGILAGLFDGDPDPLLALIGDYTVDEFVRGAALKAFTQLTFDGRINRRFSEDFLERFEQASEPPANDMAWYDWMMAVAVLGLDRLSPRVHAAFEDGRVPDWVATEDEYREILSAALERPDDAARLAAEHIGYIEDVCQSLERFLPISATDLDEDDDLLDENDDDLLDAVNDRLGSLLDSPEPVRNPLRAVGRNDPCPCGSGKKFKKCCLR